MGRLALALLVLPLSGCAATAGAAAAGAVLGAGAVAFDCPSYVVVTIRDPLTGDELCGEPIQATQRGSAHEFRSCSYAPLTDGTWVLRAERRDLRVPESRVEIKPSAGCERPVYSVELAREDLPRGSPRAVAASNRQKQPRRLGVWANSALNL